MLTPQKWLSSGGKVLVFFVLFLFLLGGSAVFSQQNSSTAPIYRMPPKAIADIVDAPSTPRAYVSPGNQWMLLMERPNLPSIEEVSQPELRLAGVRFNPNTTGSSRAYYYKKLSLKHILNQTEKEITGLPEDAKIENVHWSPDGNHIAFTLTKENGIELWAASVDDPVAKRIGDFYLNDVIGSPYHWLPDSKTFVCKLVPSDRGKEPQAAKVPTGPVIQENIGKKAPARTYQDLLEDKYDEDVFEYFLSTQVALVDLNGSIKSIGDKGGIISVEPSPNAKYLLVETIHRPFSYLVPYYRFPRRVEIWDIYGNVVQQLTDSPLAEEVPIAFGSVPTGPRDYDWRADAAAAVYWVEAQDEGDARIDTDKRDKLFVLDAPFNGKAKSLITLPLRYANVLWSENDFALVNSYWWKTRQTQTWIVKPDDEKAEPVKLFDRSYEDRYSDPGNPVLTSNKAGQSVLLTANKGRNIFLAGSGASPEGNRPFLDRLDLRNKNTERLWRSQAPYYEYPIELVDVKKNLVLTRRESVNDPPNYFLRDVKKDNLTQLTDFPHPYPQLKGVTKELIQYKREDGVKLSATLYLPAGYKKEDGPLPVFMWAYPREYKSAKAASQVSGSPYTFVRISWGSALYWLTQSYAILDGPTMPIIGEGEKEPNDTFRKQLVSSAKAAVDEVVRRGVGDRDRIAIGGHSYGAFMTANLLAHSDLFRAGIARSGAYNRTLTPFGFQSEERTYWQAPEVYYRMSPFMHADKINEPLLMIHGMADNNSGTFPIQSERMYNALKGHGATVRLVMLPFESHGYRARESVMHMLWEMDRWLGTYVKNAEPRTTSSLE